MRKIVAFIPNLFTLGNLFCGCLAIVFAFEWRLDLAAYMVFLAAFLDFFDGFLARILKVSGELGKQLDSLADMVSFGVVPGMVMYQLLQLLSEGENQILSCIAMTIPVFSCYRLAKFNIDTRQSHGFIGLPTPANALFFVSIGLIVFQAMRYAHDLSMLMQTQRINQMLMNENGLSEIEQTLIDTRHVWLLKIIGNQFILGTIIVLFSILLIVPLPLFSLKFKNFGWNDNKIRYIFLGISLALLILFQVIAIPFIVILYILISVVNNIFKITV